MKIIFMGTSTFSIPVLKSIINSDNEILAVFTKKPKKAGRDLKTQYSPIYKLAEKHSLKIFTPITFKKEMNLDYIREMKVDLLVVVSYGLILTKELLSIPKYGAINIHPSLLPKWRGAAPLERSLLSDDTETGVCIMEVEEGLDSGCIIKCEKIKLNKEIDIEFLSDYLSNKGAELILEAIQDIEKNGKIIGIKQNDENVTFADKITNKDAEINWQEDSVEKIQKKVKTLFNSVGVFIKHNDNKIKILKADYEFVENIDKNKIGTIIDKKNFFIQGKDGIFKPILLQREGKKILNVKDFVNGYIVNIGEMVK